MSPNSFDPRNHYADVTKAVRAAAKASASDHPNSVKESAVDTKVYQENVDHSRVKYWVAALDAADGEIVGLKANAIET